MFGPALTQQERKYPMNPVAASFSADTRVSKIPRARDSVARRQPQVERVALSIRIPRRSISGGD